MRWREARFPCCEKPNCDGPNCDEKDREGSAAGPGANRRQHLVKADSALPDIVIGRLTALYLLR